MEFGTVVKVQLYDWQKKDNLPGFPFILRDEYCRFCGHHGVWEDDCDDYYAGTGMHCLECGKSYQNLVMGNDNVVDKIKEVISESF